MPLLTSGQSVCCGGGGGSVRHSGSVSQVYPFPPQGCILRQGVSPNLKHTILSTLPGQQTLTICLFPLPSRGYKCTRPCLAFVSGNLNSEPQACVASILPSKPFLQAQNHGINISKLLSGDNRTCHHPEHSDLEAHGTHV